MNLIHAAALFDECMPRDGPFPTAKSLVQLFFNSGESALRIELASVIYSVEQGWYTFEGLRLTNFVFFLLHDRLQNSCISGYLHSSIPVCDDETFVREWKLLYTKEAKPTVSKPTVSKPTVSRTPTRKEANMIPSTTTSVVATPVIAIEEVTVAPGFSGYLNGMWTMGKLAMNLGVGAAASKSLTKVVVAKFCDFFPGATFVLSSKGMQAILPTVIPMVMGLPFHMGWVPEAILSKKNQGKLGTAFLKAGAGSLVILIGEIGEDFFLDILKALKVSIDD